MWLGNNLVKVLNCLVMIKGVWLGSIILFVLILMVVVVLVMCVNIIEVVELVILCMLWCLVNYICL